MSIEAARGASRAHFSELVSRFISAFAILLLCAMCSSAQAETCNGGNDNASYTLLQNPGTLTPGVPSQVRFRVTNTGTLTWNGEGNQPYPYRLGTQSSDQNPNSVIWSQFSCGGYSNSVIDQRAFLCSSVPPGGNIEFGFNLTAPIGSTGPLKFSPHMLVESGTACEGFFGDNVWLTVQVASANTCSNDNLPVTTNNWLLEVFNNVEPGGATVERRYVAPNNGDGFSYDLTNGVSNCVGASNWSTRFTRDVNFPSNGTYVFTLLGDDGIRLYIDGNRVLNEWQQQHTTFTYESGMTAGQHRITVEQNQLGGSAAAAVSWALKQTPGNPPAAPGGLSSTSGNNSVSLSWNAASGAQTYNVKRSSSSGCCYGTIATSISGTSFTDTGAANNNTYYYVVSAVNSNGESGNSNEAVGTPRDSGNPPPTCPTTPLSIPDNGWLVEIYNNRTLSGSPVEIRQMSFGFDGINMSGALPPSQCVGQNDYSIRLTRRATFSQAGNYKFQYRADDGMRARLNGVQFIDRFCNSQPNCANQIVDGTENVQISATSTQELVVEYYQQTGGADLSLQWTLDSTTQPPPNPPSGLAASGTDRKVTLTWTYQDGVDLYIVKRKNALFFYDEIGTTANARFEDTNVNNGTTYTYVVQAWNFVNGKSSDSSPVSATPQPAPQADPTLRLELRGADSQLIAPGSSLTLNADGWPSPNPIDVRMVMSCPASRTSGCFGTGSILIDSSDGRLRVNGALQGNDCAAGDTVAPTHGSMRWFCPGVIGNISLAPGETRTITATMVVQPSESTAMNVKVTWGTLGANQTVGIPAARIHPLIVTPGILGTMPPSYDHGDLDPLTAVYTPIMEQLKAIGYEEGVSLFRMPYDWRNTNIVTASHLRDRILQARTTPRSQSYVLADKVDLLVHSMGGLITRAYVQGQARNEQGQAIPYGGDVRKVLFVASPHRGFMEDYKTYESNSWSDFLYGNASLATLGYGMDKLLWPALIKKRWQAAHPGESVPALCDVDPVRGVVCADDFYSMTHAGVGGIDSLREMLPTPDLDGAFQPYFGPYLCDSYPPCIAPYPFNRPINPLLPGLNAGIGALEALLGPQNIYVMFGTDPSPNGTIDDDTDVVYDVKPGVHTFMSGWGNGEVEKRFTSKGGDDLIPDFSMNLKLLMPSIPDSNVAGSRLVNGQPQYGLQGPEHRHKQIMYSKSLQTVYAPKWLAGLGTIPYSQPYQPPSVAAALALSTGYLVMGECPLNLLITDPLGRRLGYDPVSGVRYNEIPDSVYASPNSEGQFMFIGPALAGTYHLHAVAFGEGRFALNLNQLSFPMTPRRWRVDGFVHTGDVLDYDIVVDPAQPVSQHPPVADAGPDQSLPGDNACMADVRLDGTRSSDPDGEALSYYWTGAFGNATGPQPTVRLPVGTHAIKLLVQDGQLQGSEATTHVTVVDDGSTTEKKFEPSTWVLEPPDGNLHTVTITADISRACSGKGRCKIVKVESDEGDSHDWQITGALSVKLRAERDYEKNGRRYWVKLECTFNGSPTYHRTIEIRVPPPGRMTGNGKIEKSHSTYSYKFDVAETRGGKDSGSLSLEVKFDKGHDDDSDGHSGTDKFSSTRVDYVRFYDRGDVDPGNHQKVDRVKFRGEGKYNGKSGYTFEAEATDNGEPGDDEHDRFKIRIRDPKGKTVVEVDERIDSGNNDSKTAPK